MAKKEDLEFFEKIIQAQREALENEDKLKQARQEINSSFDSYVKNLNKTTKLLKDNAKAQITNDALIQKTQELITKYEKEKQKSLAEAAKKKLDELKNNKDILNQQKQYLGDLKKQGNLTKTLVYNTWKDFGNAVSRVADRFSDIYDFLMDSDKAIKTMNKEIGLSGARADSFRKGMEDAAKFAAKMGVSLKEMAEYQNAVADATGRIVLLSSSELKNMAAIQGATNLSADSIGDMAAKYMQLGYSGDDFRKSIEGSVKQSSRLGLNSTKLLKTIDANMKAMSRFNFKGGVEGLKNMAMFAQKMNMDMAEIFRSAEKARTLEGSVEMAAQLQLVGGQFAKSDPFRLLNLARNDAEGFAKEIGNMTKGMVVFNKQSGQLDMSALDKDRLKLAADALGMDMDSLFNTAIENARRQMAESQLGGMFNKEDREMLVNMAKMNNKGQMTVAIDGQDVLLSKLTMTQKNQLVNDKKRLEELAVQNQTFDETFKNAIMELKTLVLPLLNKLNQFLQWVNSWGDSTIALIGKVVALGTAITVMTVGLGAMTRKIGDFAGKAFDLGKNMVSGGANAASSAGGGMASKVKGFFGRAGSGAASAAGAGVAENASTISKAGDAASAGTQKMGAGAGAAAAKIAAFGAAVLMIGGGIYLATKGISELADSFSKLNPDQIAGLKDVLLMLGIGIGGLVVAMLGLTAAAPAMIPAVGIMLGFAGALGIIGGAIYLASAGVSNLVDSISKLGDNDYGKILTGVATGLFALSNAAIAMASANIFSLGGLLTGGGMGSTIEKIALLKDVNLDGVGKAFGAINEFVKADTGALERLEATLTKIAQIDLSNLELLNKLNELSEKGIPLVFPDGGKMVIKNEITNEIDGFKLSKIVKDSTLRIQMGK